jgi:hypothetical protein
MKAGERSSNSNETFAVKKDKENLKSETLLSAIDEGIRNLGQDVRHLDSSIMMVMRELINSKKNKNENVAQKEDELKEHESKTYHSKFMTQTETTDLIRKMASNDPKDKEYVKEWQRQNNKKPEQDVSKNINQNTTTIANTATQNKINIEKNSPIKLAERSLTIQEAILVEVKQLHHELTQDRLDQAEAKRETDNQPIIKEEKENKTSEKKGIISTLWDTLKSGIGGLLDLIPGFKTLSSLIGPIVSAVGSLVGGLLELGGALLSPGFAAIAGIVVGIGAIAFELYKAKQLIDETDKLHKDTIKLNMQLAEQAGDAKKAKELQAQLEKEQTDSVSTLTERDRQQAEYLETKGKLEAAKEKLKDVPQFLQSRSRMGEPMMPKDNPAYIKLEKEIADLQQQADEQYKKTAELTDKSKFNIDENGFMTSKNPFEKASTGSTISQTLEDFFYQNSKNGMRTPKLAPAPEQQSLGQDMYDYSTNWLNGPANNMEPSGNFRRMMGPPNTIKGVSSKESSITPGLDQNARLKLEQAIENAQKPQASITPINNVVDNSNNTYTTSANPYYRPIAREMDVRT